MRVGAHKYCNADRPPSWFETARPFVGLADNGARSSADRVGKIAPRGFPRLQAEQRDFAHPTKLPAQQDL
jgi:hypothetical protein